MSQTCNFVPLRLEFPNEGVKGTPFEGRSETLKLVTHCQNSKESDQYVLREFLAYKISNIMLERSFRARLATVTYVDSKNGKTLMTRNGMLLEDDGDVARRMGGRTVTIERLAFKDLEIEPLTQLMVFEFMLGNTDFSIVRASQRRSRANARQKTAPGSVRFRSFRFCPSTLCGRRQPTRFEVRR